MGQRIVFERLQGLSMTILERLTLRNLKGRLVQTSVSKDRIRQSAFERKRALHLMWGRYGFPRERVKNKGLGIGFDSIKPGQACERSSI
jgi:hypothetical protein